MAAPKPSRPRPEDADTNPPESKRTKFEDDELKRKALAEDMTIYLNYAVYLGHVYARLINHRSHQLRFPILPVANNGIGIHQLAFISSQNLVAADQPPQLQMDALLGLAGLPFYYSMAEDRFEEYKYRFPEFHRAYMFDAQAATWVFYFNRAFKAYEDSYREDPDKRAKFEYPVPPHYINRLDEWVKRVEALLSKHGSLSSVFPGYGYQLWPASSHLSNPEVGVRYHGSILEFKTYEEARRKVLSFMAAKKEPLIFKRAKAFEVDRRGILVWYSS
jgi:hypothetical protein